MCLQVGASPRIGRQINKYLSNIGRNGWNHQGLMNKKKKIKILIHMYQKKPTIRHVWNFYWNRNMWTNWLIWLWDKHTASLKRDLVSSIGWSRRKFCVWRINTKTQTQQTDYINLKGQALTFRSLLSENKKNIKRTLNIQQLASETANTADLPCRSISVNLWRTLRQSGNVFISDIQEEHRTSPC